MPARGNARLANRKFDYSGITPKVSTKGHAAAKAGPSTKTTTTTNTTITTNFES
jgi:hypothetical protein